jgi:hypothetical protein
MDNIPIMVGLGFSVLAGMRWIGSKLVAIGKFIVGVNSAHQRLASIEKQYEHLYGLFFEVRKEIQQIYQYIMTEKD